MNTFDRMVRCLIKIICIFALRVSRTFYGIKETMNNLSVVESMDVADESSTFGDEDRLTLDNMIFARSGHTRCVICRLEKPSGVVVMLKAARLDMLILHSMYAPQDVRCCSSHLLNKTRLMHHTQVNTDNREHLSSSLSSSEMIELVEDLLSLLREAATSPRLDFLDVSLTEEDYLAWTGWTKDQFDDMVSLISRYLRSSSN